MMALVITFESNTSDHSARRAVMRDADARISKIQKSSILTESFTKIRLDEISSAKLLLTKFLNLITSNEMW